MGHVYMVMHTLSVSFDKAHHFTVTLFVYVHVKIGPKSKCQCTLASIECGSLTDSFTCYSLFFLLLLFVHGIQVSVYVRFSSPSLIYSAET